jgi:hypothetical protein
LLRRCCDLRQAQSARQAGRENAVSRLPESAKPFGDTLRKRFSLSKVWPCVEAAMVIFFLAQQAYA